MTEKRYVISELPPISVLDENSGDTYPIADGMGFVEEMVRLLNELHEENQLVWNKIKKMESVLPYYLSCAEVRDFHSHISEETLALTKHFKKRFQE